MDQREAERLETQTVWNGKVWVCKRCGRTPERFYVATGHDHTDWEIDWCPCREVGELEQLREQLAAQAEQIRGVVKALPGPRYMDPPDGGDVPLGEQVARMWQEVKDQADKIMVARNSLEQLSLYVAYNGDDWVQKEALAALAKLESSK